MNWDLVPVNMLQPIVNRALKSTATDDYVDDEFQNFKPGNKQIKELFRKQHL